MARRAADSSSSGRARLDITAVTSRGRPALSRSREGAVGAVASGGLSPPPNSRNAKVGSSDSRHQLRYLLHVAVWEARASFVRCSRCPAINSTTAASHPGRREPTAQSRGMVLCRIAESHPGSELPASSRSLSETRIAETPERERGLHFCFIKCCARQRRCRCVGTSRVLRPRCVHTHDWRFFSIDCFFSRSLVTSRHSSTGRHLALTLRRRDLC